MIESLNIITIDQKILTQVATLFANCPFGMGGLSALRCCLTRGIARVFLAWAGCIGTIRHHERQLRVELEQPLEAGEPLLHVLAGAESTVTVGTMLGWRIKF